MPPSQSPQIQPPSREWLGVTRRLHLEGSEGPLTCYATLTQGLQGTPYELLIRANKQGTLEHGLLHCVGLLVSLALQAGVPLAQISSTLKGVEFEPNGLTGTKDIPMVKSVADHLARWMETTYA